MKIVNTRELVNEFLVLQMTNVLILFTDFVSDQDFKYDIAGWSYVFLMGFIIAFNLGLIFRDIF
jgi:hypothetical protein